MNALCMLAGGDQFRFARMAIETSIRFLDFDRCYLAIPSVRRSDGWHNKLASLFPSKIKVIDLPGAERWEDVAKVRFGLFDRAVADGVDGWLFSVDDDDAILGSPDLQSIPSGCGMFHTAILALCLKEAGFRKPSDVFIRDSFEIVERLNSNMFRGSFYGYRSAAWKDVSSRVDRSYTDYEEWRTVWHMIRSGWKDFYFPQVLQLQRVQDYVTLASIQQERGKSWSMECSKLEAEFDAPGDRYWENWERDSRRVEVEDFWKTDPNQKERREQFYDFYRRNGSKWPKRLLDFGCGVCWDKPEFESMGYEYHGADITVGMLERARAKFPGVDVCHDDLIESKFGNKSWEVVNCSAVLPHMPKETHRRAIETLWRITKNVLVVRLFGVDTHEEDTTLVLKGFLYNRFREATWMEHFKAMNPRKIVVERGKTKATKDIMIVALWK